MGAWPVYYVWPMPSHFIFESLDNWLNTHKADWHWPIIILLIGRDGQSRGQRALAWGVLDFTHRIPTPQCTLGFVKRNYCGEINMFKPITYLVLKHASPVFQGKSRPVHHFHFTGWPDRGVPLMATSLLEFRRVVRSYDNTAKGPLIVHCRSVKHLGPDSI